MGFDVERSRKVASCVVAIATMFIAVALAVCPHDAYASSISAASTASSAASSAELASAASSVASAESASVASSASTTATDDKMVLFINSYDPGFDTVPVVREQVARVLKGHATIHYLFMNEKYETDEFASSMLSSQLDYLTSNYHYDAVILGDDAAFDFAIKNRDTYFSGTPLIYEDVNSVDKAELYKDDPLITGVVEAFPMKETIELARQVMPQATRVVVISDGSVSAKGSVEQALGEQKDFPDLTFETFDCSTRSPAQIADDIAAYGDDTILLYTVFNVDDEGNRYSVAQGVKLITDAAQIPVFKADGVGVGDGLLGGYVLSYESIGQQTGQLVLDVLEGTSGSSVEGYTTGSCEYLFDASVMKRFGISKSQLPDGSSYLNDTPDFLQTYGWVLLVVIVVIVGGIAVFTGSNHIRQRKLQKELDERNVELRAEEAASRAKTEFISRMSHDIRTPLNAMLGMNELAREHVGDKGAVEDYLLKSHASGELLLSLVNNILDVSKIESGKMQLDPSSFHLADFFDNLETIFRPMCERKGVEFIVRHDAGQAIVTADRVRLDQVFCNLLSNAIKFTPEGGKVTLALKSELADGMLHGDFIVADTGPGIAEDFKDKMFQAFTQDTRTSSASGQGSGLGLVIVRSIVDLMGGSIEVGSEAGKGTSFLVHLDLPLADEGAISSDHHNGVPAVSAEWIDQTIAGHRVLVVEDNDLNAEIILTILTQHGMEVSRAADGKEAVDLVASSADGAFDVILMDNRMPIMSGMDATRAIRSMDRAWAKRVPIIALTADAFEDDVRSLLDAGMDACLTKPVDIGKLLRMIATYLHVSGEKTDAPGNGGDISSDKDAS